MFGKASRNQIVAEFLFKKEALGLALFGNKPDTGAHRLPQRCEPDGLAMKLYLAGCAVHQSGDGAHDLAAAGPQSGGRDWGASRRRILRFFAELDGALKPHPGQVLDPTPATR